MKPFTIFIILAISLGLYNIGFSGNTARFDGGSDSGRTVPKPLTPNIPDTASDNRGGGKTDSLDPPKSSHPKINEAEIKKLPDLSLTKMKSKPLSVKSGSKNKIEVEVTVKNSGEDAIRSVRLRFQAGKTRMDKSISLKRKSEKKVKVTLTVDQNRFKLICIIDPDNKIDEIDNKNNRIEAKVSISAPTEKRNREVALSVKNIAKNRSAEQRKAELIKKKRLIQLKPDLSAEDIKLNKPSYLPEQSFTAFLTVKNNGKVTVEKGEVVLKKKDKVIDKQFITIKAGKEQKLKFKGKTGSPGNYALSAVIDPDNKIKELSNKNNQITIALKVRKQKNNVLALKDTGKLSKKVLNTDLAKKKDKEQRHKSLAMKHDSGVQKPPLKNSGTFTKNKLNQDLTTLAGQTLTFLLPKKDSTLLNGKTYEIKWVLSGTNPNVKKVEIIKTDNFYSEDITPKTIISFPGKTGLMGFSYTVPQNLTNGSYHIHVTADSVVNGKKQTITSASLPFNVSWAMPVKITKIEDQSKLFENLAKLNAMKPYISFFDYSEKVYGSSGQLKVRFFWNDKDSDLYDGSWILEYYDYNIWHKKTLKFKTNNPMLEAQLVGPQGLAELTIPLPELSTATPIRFWITDKAGFKSNVVSGVVNKHKGILAPAPVSVKDHLEFVNPPYPKDPSNTYNNFNQWVKPGSTYTIKLKGQVLDNRKDFPVDLHVGMTGQMKKLATIKLPNDGSVVSYKWKVPANITQNQNIIRFVASAPAISDKPAMSGIVVVSDYTLKVTNPAAKQKLTAGSTIAITWKQPQGAASTDKINFFYSPGNGASAIKINVNPVSMLQQWFDWYIDPATVNPGQGTLLCTLDKKMTPLSSTPINIDFPQGALPLEVEFDVPSKWKITRWLENDLQKVVWKKFGKFPPALAIDLMLEPANDPSQRINLRTLSKNATKGETFIRVPNSQGLHGNKGVYRLIAVRTDLYSVVGRSSLIEIVPAKLAESMMPPQTTQFNIKKVTYNYDGAKATIDITTDSQKDFRLSQATAQKLIFKITNYKENSPSETVVIKKIEYKDTAHYFPSWIIPRGTSGYNIRFTPYLKATPTVYSTSEKKSSSHFGAGKICLNKYYPKLEVSLETTHKGGYKTIAKHTEYLTNFSGMKKEHHSYLSTSSKCSENNSW